MGGRRDPPRGVEGLELSSKEVLVSYKSLKENDCETDRGCEAGVIFSLLWGVKA